MVFSIGNIFGKGDGIDNTISFGPIFLQNLYAIEEEEDEDKDKENDSNNKKKKINF
jgi:hypothetical protein